MRKLLTLLGIVCLVLMIVALPFMTACAKPAPAPTPAPAPAPAPTPAPAPIVWKLNSAYPATHVAHPYLESAVKEISKRSNGRLVIDIYPALALGFKVPTWFRDHKDGLIDISKLTNMMTCGEEPSFCIVEADNLFTSREQQIKSVQALSDFKKKVYKDVWNTELIATGFMPSETSVIATKGKQVTGVADLKGLKLRAPNERFKELVQAFGAAPQSMPKSELYMALKTGVLDGFGSGYGSLYAEKLYEVFDFVVATGISAACQEDIVVSRKVWDPLPDDLKKIVRDVFAQWAATTSQRDEGVRVANEDKALLEKAGKICLELSKEDKTRFREKAVELNDAWVKSQGGRVAEAWEIVKPFLAK